VREGEEGRKKETAPPAKNLSCFSCAFSRHTLPRPSSASPRVQEQSCFAAARCLAAGFRGTRPVTSFPPHGCPPRPTTTTTKMVQVKTLQITWHAKEGRKNDPILAVDFHPTLPLLATAGADFEIKIWRVSEPPAGGAGAGAGAGAGPAGPRAEAAAVEYAFTLVGHTKSVNCVRWSPNGECLASASDGERILNFGRCALQPPPTNPQTKPSHSPTTQPHPPNLN
jgi:WD40 repeat protein